MKSIVVLWKAMDGGKGKQEVLDAALASLKGKKIEYITQSESGTVTANYRIR